MKTIKFFAYALFVCFLGVSISSCNGEDGADGIDGLDGTTGPAGDDGQDGNANVIYSDWIIPTWSAGSFYSVQVQEYYITTTELSLDVVNHGVVLMYWKNSFGHIWPLPSSGLGGNLIIDFTFSENTLHLYVFDWVNGTLPPAIPSSNVFRYVIIPGNISGRSNLNSQQEIYTELENAGIDIKDYKGICDYYGIAQ